MSEDWKKHDRPCPPCVDCGAELFEKFWGNGGWAKTEVGDVEPHDEGACVARLKAKVHRMQHALERIASGAYDSLAGDPGQWPCNIAANALGWVQDEEGGPLRPPGMKKPA